MYLDKGFRLSSEKQSILVLVHPFVLTAVQKHKSNVNTFIAFFVVVRTRRPFKHSLGRQPHLSRSLLLWPLLLSYFILTLHSYIPFPFLMYTVYILASQLHRGHSDTTQSDHNQLTQVPAAMPPPLYFHLVFPVFPVLLYNKALVISSVSQTE